MSIINYASREIQFKIVYYGPALCGKTTNLGYIHKRINPENRGDLVSLATAADRTLFFDFLPLNAVVIKGFVTKFQLYTVPGQSYYNATRKLVLQGADGVVYVGDSQARRFDDNLEQKHKDGYTCWGMSDDGTIHAQIFDEMSKVVEFLIDDQAHPD